MASLKSKSGGSISTVIPHVNRVLNLSSNFFKSSGDLSDVIIFAYYYNVIH